MIRLFVAMSLPVDVRIQLTSLQSGLAGARWIDSSSMHLTLRFIGNIAEPEVQDIGQALSDIHAPAFDLSMSGIGYFERRGYVHSVWARVEKTDPLMHLQSKIESAMVRCGCDPETRKYTPHVTLGRLKDTPVERIGPWLENSGAAVVPPFGVEGFTLFQSERGHGGAKYTALEEYDLVSPV